MKAIYITLILFILLTIFLYFGINTYANTVFDIYISEVMVNPKTGEKEWIELYNNSDENIEIQDWYIDDEKDGGSSKKKFSLTVPKKGYAVYVLSSAIFNNGGDTVRLLNEKEEEIETLDYSESEKEKTWARGTVENDVFCLQSHTKGEKNALCEEQKPTDIPEPTTKPTEEKSPTVTDSPPQQEDNEESKEQEAKQINYDKIYISEAMVNPETGQKEWLELYNDDDRAIKLIDWYIDDENEAGSAPKRFSAEIQAKGYFYYTLSTGIFNNGGDHVRLLNPDKKEVENFIYTFSEKDLSWGRSSINSNNFCLQTASPGEKNNNCQNNSDDNIDSLSGQESSDEIIDGSSSNMQAKNSTHSTSEINEDGEKSIQKVKASIQGVSSTKVIEEELPDYMSTIANGKDTENKDSDDSGELFPWEEGGQDTEIGNNIDEHSVRNNQNILSQILSAVVFLLSSTGIILLIITEKDKFFQKEVDSFSSLSLD